VTAILIALNILAGLFLIGVVLLQSGKGADMGAAFGGAGSTVFGPSSPGNVLTKVTAATAALFMITSLGLAILSAQDRSVFEGMAEPEPLATPASPAATPPPVAGTGAAGEDAAAVADTAEQAAGGAGEVADPGTVSLEDAVKNAGQDAVDTGAAKGAASAAAVADQAAAAEAQGQAAAGQAAATGAAEAAPAAADQAAGSAMDAVKEAVPADETPPAVPAPNVEGDSAPGGGEGAIGDDPDPAQQPVDRMAAQE